ncbi:MAG: glycosyltransferase family 39 protein [Planctomycetota bacterium]|jgi:4-amino-4-deoxy-L-arabinose transferase-like glycosyltransferase
MARRIKKKSTSQKQTTPDTGVKQSALPIGLLISILVTAILAGIPFGMGKYIELNSPGPYDSGAYVYSAKHLLDGAQMGIDENPSARPLTLLANIVGVKLFGFNDTGPKIVQMILQLAALIFMFWTARKVFGHVAAVISTALAALYLSAPLIAKFGNVKEQFMIPFMIAAACAFCWYAASQKRGWLIASGFFALQPYYSKPTGMSIVFAIVVYILVANAVSKKWKSAWVELALFLSGYAAGLIIPGTLYLWQGITVKLLKTFPPMAILLGVGVLLLTAIPALIHTAAEKKNIEAVKKIPQWAWGIAIFVVVLLLTITQWGRIMSAAGLKGGGYLGGSRSAKSMADVTPQIFRYYKALIVPVLMAILSIIPAAVVWLPKRARKKSDDIQPKLVWMLALWWILDMAFVWISPRSYEQYYLPLCASAAVLSGFAVWAWTQKVKAATVKIPWLIGGVVPIIVLSTMTIPIFIGQRYSPDTGTDYINAYKTRKRGFAQALNRVKKQGRQPWQTAGDYIRTHSTEDDTIYVWGWMPGIYVQAQRLAPVPAAFESNMHVTPPKSLASKINRIVKGFEENPPKFIVDTRKRHFPNDRPPLELWPMVPPNMFGNKRTRPLNNNPQEIAAFDGACKKFLETKIEPDEAKRYEAMKPFRDFVMTRYKIVNRKEFGSRAVFERID